MTWLSQNDVERLGADLAVANSASYIFRRFRADPTVKALALRDGKELLEGIRRSEQAAPPKLEDEVLGYAAAVAALTSGHAPDLTAYIATSSGALKWLPQLIELARQEAGPPVNVVSIGQNQYQFNVSTPANVRVTSTSSGTSRPSSRSEKLVLSD
jgi:hypothetical protein